MKQIERITGENFIPVYQIDRDEIAFFGLYYKGAIIQPTSLGALAQELEGDGVIQLANKYHDADFIVCDIDKAAFEQLQKKMYPGANGTHILIINKSTRVAPTMEGTMTHMKYRPFLFKSSGDGIVPIFHSVQFYGLTELPEEFA